MKSKFFFPPAHMQLTARNICEELGLSEKTESTSKNKMDPFFENLLRQICSLSAKAAEQKAMELKTPDLIRIIEYLPRNELNLPLKNLVAVIINRRNTLLFPHLFLAWKKSYTSELTQIITSFYHDENHKRIPSDFPITPSLWDQWRRLQEDMPLAIAKWLCKSHKELNELQNYNINKSDVIYQAVWQNMILTCDANQLDAYSSNEIKEVLRVFSGDKQVMFLENFLNPFPSHEVLKQRKEIYVWIEGNKDSLFWKSLNDELRQKIKKWKAVLDITNVFGNDERSLFWMKYIDVLEEAKVVYKGRKDLKTNGGAYKTTDIYQMALIFKKFVVVEFTEIGYAARAISLQNYKVWIESVFNKSENLSNNQLRYKLIHDMPSERIVHTPLGEWQDDAIHTIYKWLYQY